jgi:hypothetical protein
MVTLVATFAETRFAPVIVTSAPPAVPALLARVTCEITGPTKSIITRKSQIITSFSLFGSHTAYSSFDVTLSTASYFCVALGAS